ncbi:hypothetical protein GOBAR_AA33773 [Gossypium barbadense]|uniref:Uncharacterized protein n=1 Tax=Gossypium barbadense TaxID=3634 RepID=A0A2P5W775_GOSBA|nr:hypothetical protein GOBAR_AA33773 [Gossypium barbadense]
MSHARVEETESSLVPSTPVGFNSHARVFLSSSPTAMSNGCGDLAHPVSKLRGKGLSSFRIVIEPFGVLE